MSAESGVPTYRGRCGIWNQYKWENYACQTAFERDPEGVLEFHELRRIEALKCQPHSGHTIITDVQNDHSDSIVITQNIDGMHQRAKSKNVIELHGSLWRLRCESENLLKQDLNQGKYQTVQNIPFERNRECTESRSFNIMGTPIKTKFGFQSLNNSLCFLLSILLNIKPKFFLVFLMISS